MGIGITRGAANAVNDLLDNCLEIMPGDEVVIASHIDGLYGGDNLVDTEAVTWIQTGVQARGANPSILWIDEPQQVHKWRVPPVFLAALEASNVFINNSFDLTIEELKIIQETATEHNVRLGRNFATTAGLLNSPWAQTPHELLAEIRYQACVPFGNGGMSYEISDDSGTHIEGMILAPNHPRFPTYTRRRNEGPGYRPFPEWVFPPINVGGTNGTIVFDRTLSWWSRYIGVPPVFEHPIHLTVENNRITRIEGKHEAEALKAFLKFLESRFDIDVYNFPEIHSGIHPQAVVAPQQCSHPLVRRIIDHSGSCNIHFHIGAPWPKPSYPYWVHITGDLRKATWRVGNHLIHDRGHMTALDHPKVKEVADKFPERPGLKQLPKVC